MIEINIEQFNRYCDLKEKYVEKYKKLNLPEFMLFPREFYDIDDYGIQGDILEEALTKGIRVEQTDSIIEMHEANIDHKLSTNLDESTRRRMK